MYSFVDFVEPYRWHLFHPSVDIKESWAYSEIRVVGTRIVGYGGAASFGYVS